MRSGTLGYSGTSYQAPLASSRTTAGRPIGLLPVTGSLPCWNSTFGALVASVRSNAPGANRSMKRPSYAESISVHSLNLAKWPNMTGPADVSRITCACPSAG